MVRSARQLFLAMALSAGCATTQTASSRALPSSPAAVDYGMRVFGGDGESNVSAMVDTLARADYVLVGETHLDDQTHRLEHTILEGIVARRGPSATVLSMEMFTRDQQPALDAYLEGAIDEATFIERAPPWPNYRTGYRPLVETAKRDGVGVVGANLPRTLQRMFGMKKSAAMRELTEEQRTWFPDEVFPPADSYWTRIEGRLRDAGHGHMGALDAEGRTWSIQNLWDNTMADAMVKARASTPNAVVVHMVGAFHAEYGDGIAHQLRQRDPNAKIAIVTVEPVHDLRNVDATRIADRADYVVFALADARGLHDDTYGVTVTTELRYRLAAPEVGEPKGLLIWLGDDETSSEDAVTYWKAALGSEVMIAVIEHPHRVRTNDARMSGRWTWPDRYAADTALIATGIDKTARYLRHRWQLPKERVVVAGRGAGADVALWTALYGRAPQTVIAIDPQSPERIAEAGLPDRVDRHRTVVIGADPQSIAAAMTTLELAAVTASVRPDIDMESELRAAFGLPDRALAGTAISLKIDVDTPIARQWAQLHARLRERDGTPHTVLVDTTQPPTLTVDPASFAEGQGLPLAPGPFGGTTILVLPPQLSPEAAAQWKQLGVDDVLKKRSRFATLVVVEDAELGPKLDELRAKGKRSMLIVPAAFAVTPARMDVIQSLVDGHDDELRLHYLPGLGGSAAQATCASTGC